MSLIRRFSIASERTYIYIEKLNNIISDLIKYKIDECVINDAAVKKDELLNMIHDLHHKNDSIFSIYDIRLYLHNYPTFKQLSPLQQVFFDAICIYVFLNMLSKVYNEAYEEAYNKINKAMKEDKFIIQQIEKLKIMNIHEMIGIKEKIKKMEQIELCEKKKKVIKIMIDITNLLIIIKLINNYKMLLSNMFNNIKKSQSSKSSSYVSKLDLINVDKLDLHGLFEKYRGIGVLSKSTQEPTQVSTQVSTQVVGSGPKKYIYFKTNTGKRVQKTVYIVKGKQKVRDGKLPNNRPKYVSISTFKRNNNLSSLFPADK
jgi:hypothetical protein